MSSTSPVMKAVSKDGLHYTISVLFNSEGQLIRVDGSNKMSRYLLIEHLAVAIQAVAKIAAEEERELHGTA